MVRFFATGAFVLSVVLVVASAMFLFGPVLETQFWPVYSSFRAISIDATSDGKARAKFEFTKFRSCSPQGFTWYSGQAGAAYSKLDVTVVHDASQPLVRPLGEQLTSTYIIDVDPDVMRDGVYAEVYSRCHPFWTTRSVVYP